MSLRESGLARAGPGGELLAQTVLHHSNDLFFRERLPWRLGLIKLDCGPTVVAHLHEAGRRIESGSERRSTARDRPSIAALPEKEKADMAEDRQLREFTCDPKQRKVLITDGKTALGQALAKALAEAGAEIIWVGHTEPWKKFRRLRRAARTFPRSRLLPLDVTDSKNVREAAAEIAGKVDILVNNAELHRSFGIANRQGVETARAEMDVNYFGLLRLAQEFGPAMRSRGADGKASAVAWVNLLSIYAHANFPPHGTFSASKAAAHSLAQCLRAEMRPAGVRVVNVFPGPDRRRMEPAPAAAEAAPRIRWPTQHPGSAARRRRGRLSRRCGAGMAGPLAR